MPVMGTEVFHYSVDDCLDIDAPCLSATVAPLSNLHGHAIVISYII